MRTETKLCCCKVSHPNTVWTLDEITIEYTNNGIWTDCVNTNQREDNTLSNKHTLKQTWGNSNRISLLFTATGTDT